MSDLERLIKRSLEGVGHSYSPSDEIAARERFIRLRRRRRGYWFAGTAAATAMAVAVTLFVVPSRIESPEDPIQVAARPLEVVETIEVGGNPASVATSGEHVWVSNAAGGSVVRVDPSTGDVESILSREGQTPDELAAWNRDLWVTTTTGAVTYMNGSTGEIYGDLEGPLTSPTATVSLDIAAGEEGLWAVSPSESGSFQFTVLPLPVNDLRRIDWSDAIGLTLMDVAVGDGLFGLDVSGTVYRGRGMRGFWPGSDAAGEGAADDIARVEGVGHNSDLAAGLGQVWVSTASGEDLRIVRIDPLGEADLQEIALEGRYADMAVGGRVLWVLAGNGDSKLLYRINPQGELVGDPLELPGSTNDIAVGAGSAWVPDTEAGTVLRIEEVSGEEPEPVATEPADEDPPSAQPFFAYSVATGEPFPDAGDIFVEMTDGTTQQITQTPDDERNPVFDLGKLIFERHDHETDWFGLIEHDLATGEEQIVPREGSEDGIRGRHPAVSAGGDLAWVNEDGAIEVMTGGETMVVPLPEALSDPRGLIFSDDAKALYYQAIGEGWVTVQVPLDQRPSPTPFVLNGINDQPRGTTYVQPDDATGDNITVLDVCCRDTEGDPYSQFSIAHIAFTEGGATHEGITGPVPLQDADPGALTMVSLHGALLNEDGSWDLFADEGGSWLVTDGATLWLLNSDGGGQLGPDTLETGADLHGVTVDPTLEGDS